jgi:hypothetical protein
MNEHEQFGSSIIYRFFRFFFLLLLFFSEGCVDFVRQYLFVSFFSSFSIPSIQNHTCVTVKININIYIYDDGEV